MTIKKLKQEWKSDLVDVVASLIVTGGAYFYLGFIGQVEQWFIPVMFMLILIYLKLPNRK